MSGFPKLITGSALQHIAAENIKEEECHCYWHKIGRPEECECILPMPDLGELDEFPDFDRREDPDPFDDIEDYPCMCFWCRTGRSECCVQWGDDSYKRYDFSGNFIADGAVAFDDVPEPRVRVNKRTRTSRHEQIVRWGRVCENEGAMLRYRRSLANEKRKKPFLKSRRDRERIGQILAREEENDREFWIQQDLRYFDGFYPEECVRLHPTKRAELLMRNFPSLVASSAKFVASSRMIQNSSSFKGLEDLQQEEVLEARRKEDYFAELDGAYFGEDLETRQGLLDCFNHAALLFFQH